MKAEDLLKLKEEIDQSKSRISEFNGRLKTHLEDLEKQWDCKTLEEAQEKQEALVEEQKVLEDKIQKGLEELEETYNL